MGRLNFFVAFFVLYFSTTNGQTEYPTSKPTQCITELDAFNKLGQDFDTINKKLDELNIRLNTMQLSLDKNIPSHDNSKCLVGDVIDSINNQRFDIAVETLIKLGDSKVIVRVVHDVYAGSSTNVENIVSFAKALNNGEWQFLVFSAVIDEIIASGNTEPIIMINVVGAFEAELAKQSDPSLKIRAKIVIDRAIQYITQTSVTIFRTAMIANNFQVNVDIVNLADALFEFRMEVSDDVINRVVESEFGVVDATQILENISSLENIPQVVIGLTAIFNKFNNAGNLNDNAILKLASYLRELQDRENYIYSCQELKINVNNLIERLPANARNLYFAPIVCLWNNAEQQYLYAGDDSNTHDAERRNIFIKNDGSIMPGSLWNVTEMEGAFYWQNIEYTEEYLYSPEIDQSYSDAERYAFTWIPGQNTDPQSAWGIELDGEFIYMKSIYNNEYLYASNVKYDDLNNYVFTSRSGSLVKSAEYQWQIRNCAQPV